MSDFNDQKELTKMINQNNENTFAARAEQAGGHLKMVRMCAGASVAG